MQEFLPLTQATPIATKTLPALPQSFVARPTKAVASELGGIFVGADVTDEEQVTAAVAAATELGELRACINCAGIGIAEAWEALEYAADIDDEPQRLSVLATAGFDLGDTGASGSAIDNLDDGFADSFPLKAARAHAWRGEIEDAFRWLDRAVLLDDGVGLAYSW